MCQYCEKTFTGDANLTMADDKIDINGHTEFFLETFIDYKKDSVTIKTNLTNMGGFEIASTKMKISYCPICGRHLS